MTRQSRTFKLLLSPAGQDLLIEAHCHMIRCTRQMLAWGTTLQLAVLHLETVPPARIEDQLERLPALGLMGDHRHFVGAPKGLSESAAAIANSVSVGGATPTISSIYLVALQQLLVADSADLRSALERARWTTPARINPNRM
ncbi:hypothetical protein M9978_12890 [Sphingomonas sp. MG17]|uniref:Uncharacterized protein n=1 Tax=Sphingomonas tagetis TaxID=2949092 RepID=A0A9X2HLA9_9SPHN|nr:hypothetical protein [Sphingomonas tagetis]MCP3731324.1 hypothetical protein [Sphingomonas tagetis]